jgi:hypothetical protein
VANIITAPEVTPVSYEECAGVVLIDAEPVAHARRWFSSQLKRQVEEVGEHYDAGHRTSTLILLLRME